MRRYLLTGMTANPRLTALLGFASMMAMLAFSMVWPVVGGDTGRILGEAANIAEGKPLGPTGLAFLLPHALLSIGNASAFQGHAYVFLQVTLAAIATVCLFQLALLVLGDHAWAIVATCAWSMNPLVQGWNFYVLSDGLYQSLLIIYAFLLSRLLTPSAAVKNKVIWVSVTAVTLLCVTFCRPHGRLIPIATAVALLITPLPRRQRLYALPALVLFEIWLVLLNSRYSVHMNMIQHFEAGRVVWGYPGFTLSMPHSAEHGLTGLAAVLDYGLSYPFQTLKLAVVRIAVEISGIRPFYSFAHNLISGAAFCAMNILAVLGMWKSQGSAAKSVTLVFIITHLGIVGLTHADWDGRWYLEVLPFICIWGIFGVRWMVRWIPALQNFNEPIVTER